MESIVIVTMKEHVERGWKTKEGFCAAFVKTLPNPAIVNCMVKRALLFRMQQKVLNCGIVFDALGCTDKKNKLTSEIERSLKGPLPEKNDFEVTAKERLPKFHGLASADSSACLPGRVKLNGLSATYAMCRVVIVPP
ncbi:hypothetical protein T11_13526 [Trichinella zimbabwensis]|uniref:Uncharacterized protein n=1 Tax=Trichinella zimbabwensis TaxID=268475 RepID=A0A0V1I1K7_9BILA|nr:hypothetical protein T11_13526 [Trichinella zimbabwensis]